MNAPTANASGSGCLSLLQKDQCLDRSQVVLNTNGEALVATATPLKYFLFFLDALSASMLSFPGMCANVSQIFRPMHHSQISLHISYITKQCLNIRL